MGIGKDGYWSPREMMGYSDPRQDVMYYLVLSDRGRGKSYSTKFRLMKRYEEHGELFMCIYRNGDDLADAMEEWVDPLVKAGYNPERFKWDGDVKKGGIHLYFDGVKIGWFRALTKVNAIKHEYFPDELVNIWWDEFIPLAWKKLPGIRSEGDALRTIVKTVDHDSTRSRKERGLKQISVFLYANPFTWDNPILSYFKVNPLVGYGVHRVGPGVVCEMIPPIEKDRGYMTADDFLGQEVNRNEGWKDQMAYIEKVPSGSVPMLSFRFDTRYFTIYSAANGRRYVKETNRHANIMRRNPMTGKEFRYVIGTHEGLKEDERCIEDGGWKRILTGWLYDGETMYHDANTKFDWVGCVMRM